METNSFFLDGQEGVREAMPPSPRAAFPSGCLAAQTNRRVVPNIPPSRDGRPNSLGIGASRSFWLLPAELGSSEPQCPQRQIPGSRLAHRSLNLEGMKELEPVGTVFSFHTAAKQGREFRLKLLVFPGT